MQEKVRKQQIILKKTSGSLPMKEAFLIEHKASWLAFNDYFF